MNHLTSEKNKFKTMKNLISTTDFNIKQFDLLFTDQITESLYIDRVVKYAKILKRPIKKNMFVPCGLNGDIINEPLQEDYTDCTDEQNAKDWLYNLDKYNELKQSVLFHGWGFLINSLSGVETGVRNEVVFDDCVIYFKEDKPAIFFEEIKNIQTPINTVEDLLKTTINFELTESFRKEIKL